ncbi:MAG: DPP IV N-terminal domain-containing protein [Planctomycetota bacterium]
MHRFNPSKNRLAKDGLRNQGLLILFAFATLLLVFDSTTQLAAQSAAALSQEQESENRLDPKIAKWESAIQKLESLDATETHKTNAILFCGSSSIRRWHSLDGDMKPWTSMNRGYGGAKLTDLNHYADRLIGPHIGPGNPRRCQAVVVFVANDIAGSKNSTDPQPAEVVERFKTLLKYVRSKDETIPFFWIEVTPTEKRWHVWNPILKATEGIRNVIAADENAHFIGTAGAFIGKDETPIASLFVKDRLHLNEEGYQRWAAIIKAAIQNELGPATTQQKQDVAQTKTPLSIDRIFGSREFSADGFSVNWMPTGGKYFVKQKSKSGEGNDIVLVDPLAANQPAEVLIPASKLIPEGKQKPIAIESFQVAKNKSKVLIYNSSKRVWRYNTRGDYWVADLLNGTVKKLGGSEAKPSTLMFAKFSPDGKSVAYVRERNVYVESLESGKIYPVTKTENEFIINGTSDWVYEEELDLRDGFSWSDDGNQIVFWRFDTSDVGLFTMVNNTDKLYPRLIQFQYPKVGTTNSAVSIGIFDLASGGTRYVDLPGDARENYPAKLDWIPGTKEFLLQYLNRLQNKNTIYAVDAQTGTKRVVFEDRDSAWVEVCDQIKFSDDSSSFTFVSEEDGWKHVYMIETLTGKRTLLTPGDFDITELYRVDLENQFCDFQASPNDSKSRFLYRQKFGNSQLQRLTPEGNVGWHDYQFSADGSTAVHTGSQMGSPPIIEFVALPAHQPIRTAADNATLVSKLGGLNPIGSEFVKLEIDDGQQGKLDIDASIMYPLGFNKQDPSKKYPVIVYVYGEPWGTTVTDRWDGRNYMWHRYLCEQGYVVMSFDNRGAKCPRGTKWRKAIYKKIGIINAADQAASLKAALKKFSFLDKDRIGIWGWSGGGSSTLNALFQYPDLYHVGVSVAPVPDQRYYDTIYQERYMQTPTLNPEGFRLGSPITHAEKLKGKLLLIHGTGDDNCHYQTMELLINQLIAKDKQFQMMAYPNRSHSIREYENTTPHLRQMMTNFFLDNLPRN